MATVAYNLWYNEVLPEAPGCLAAVAENAIRNAAIEFCERSQFHIYNHPAINAVAATATYAFVPPANTLVVKVLQAFYNSKEIIPKTPDELDSMYTTTDWRDRTGTPLYYTQDDELNIRLVPYPSASLANALKLRVSLKPTRASTTVEARIYEEHLESIKAGALYRLKAQTSKPYSDPTGAANNLTLFNMGIDSARDRVSRGFGRAHRRVYGHYF